MIKSATTVKSHLEIKLVLPLHNFYDNVQHQKEGNFNAFFFVVELCESVAVL